MGKNKNAPFLRHLFLGKTVHHIVLLHRNFAKDQQQTIINIMNKQILTLGLLTIMMAVPTRGLADEPVIENIIKLQLGDIQPDRDRPRTPARPLSIGQNGHELHFFTVGDYEVNIYSISDEGIGNMEYTELVPTSCSSILLPSDLTGIYAIEVVRGSLHFWGDIEL